MTSKDDFKPKMTEEFKIHLFKLLEQRQGMDVMQNYFAIDTGNRLPTLEAALINARRYKMTISDNTGATHITRNKALEDISIIDDLLSTLPDTPGGFNVPELRRLAVENAEFILSSYTYLIESFEADLDIVSDSFPDEKREIKNHIEKAKQVRDDFTILLTLKFPASTPYLREYKEKFLKEYEKYTLDEFLKKINKKA